MLKCLTVFKSRPIIAAARRLALLIAVFTPSILVVAGLSVALAAEVVLRPQIGHSSTVSAVAFSLDDKLIISTSDDGTLRLWDSGSGRLIRRIENPATSARSISFTNTRVVMASTDAGVVAFWRVDTGELVGVLRPPHDGWVSAAIMLPDGHRILSGSYDGTLKIWDLDKSPALVNTIKVGGSVTSLAVSPAGDSALVGSSNGLLELWDINQARLVRTLEGHTARIYAVAFFPDGKSVLSAGEDGSLRIWNYHTGIQTRVLKQSKKSPDAPINAVAVSPNGKMIISGGNDQTITAHDQESGEVIWTQQGQSSYIVDLAYSQDGKLVVSGGFDRGARGCL
ncbi:WD40 repeat domain-containing protein [Rhizobium laguerreae]|uniref:WD40 repeat domain-containing protein n=1 Tax=Rhizobium laguerreae TaxID=1076926 RepID=UPI0021B0A24F|nr:WD40 repeat domain-containing protein [Rhizobium laguerreae]